MAASFEAVLEHRLIKKEAAALSASALLTPAASLLILQIAGAQR